VDVAGAGRERVAFHRARRGHRHRSKPVRFAARAQVLRRENENEAIIAQRAAVSTTDHHGGVLRPCVP